MYLKPYQIDDISNVKPAGGRGLEVDVYDVHFMRDLQKTNNVKLYTYLNRPLRKATDSRTGGLHLVNPEIDSGSVIIAERPWNGQNRRGSNSEYGAQGWSYNRENIPNHLLNSAALKAHNQAAINYSIQEEKDKQADFLKYQNRVHIVSAIDRIAAEQGLEPSYGLPVENIEVDSTIYTGEGRDNTLSGNTFLSTNQNNYIDRRAGLDSATGSDPTDRIFGGERDYVDNVIPRNIELFTPTEKLDPGFYGVSSKQYATTGQEPKEYSRVFKRPSGIYSQNMPRRENFTLLGDGKEIGKNGHWYASLILVFVILGFILCYGLSKNMRR